MGCTPQTTGLVDWPTFLCMWFVCQGSRGFVTIVCACVRARALLIRGPGQEEGVQCATDSYNWTWRLQVWGILSTAVQPCTYLLCTCLHNHNFILCILFFGALKPIVTENCCGLLLFTDKLHFPMLNWPTSGNGSQNPGSRSVQCTGFWPVMIRTQILRPFQQTGIMRSGCHVGFPHCQLRKALSSTEVRHLCTL
jgi:hypothetical protein